MQIQATFVQPISATESFVASFIAILTIDFFLGMFLINLHDYFWRRARRRPC